MAIDRKSKGLMLLLVLSIAAVLSGILLTVQALNSQVAVADNEQTTVKTTSVAATTQTTDVTAQATTDDNYTTPPQWMCMGLMPGMRGRGPRGWGQYGFIEVSAEFEQKVTDIAKNDTDVQQLLSNGYNITRVMPIIRTVVDGDGNVVMKATNATVLLEKDTTGRAFVLVDLQQSKVTQVVILTKTVIEKP
jgi:hypothetical protein